MSIYQYIVTASFGLEAVVKRELEALELKIAKSEDGRITFEGDERALVKANLWLRCADRVYLKLAEFKAETFPELIKNAESIPWEKYLEADGKFIVTGTSVKSTLHSVPACQSTFKKAIINRLSKAFKTDSFKENGISYGIRFMIHKDQCLVMLDSSGEGLHKRGYRVGNVSAPIKETLAAAMVSLSFYKAGRLLVDPMCGSGTIPIEAAMMARNIAPGLSRKFDAEKWSFIPKELWQEERKAAYGAIDYNADVRIFASDIDSRAVEAAKQNAEQAGVDDCIQFSVKPAARLTADEEKGIVICNPPYGQRIGDQKAMDGIYKDLARFFKANPSWSLFLITADKTFEQKFGKDAARRRKLYNGGIEACYYQYHGTK